MDAAVHDDRPCADDRPTYRTEPRLIFGGLPGLALAARLCRTQLDDGTWTGLADTARKLTKDESYRVKDSMDWKVKCACETVHVVPYREIVTCTCDRLYMQDGETAYVFELGPQEADE